MDNCKIINAFLHLSSWLQPVGTIVRKAAQCKKGKDTDNIFDYQSLSLCFGVILPRLKWSWRESNPIPI